MLIDPTRRRRHLAAASGAPVPPSATMPGITPVPGTEAARVASAKAAQATGARPHVLLDPDLASRPADPKVGMPTGMKPAEVADRIVAKLLEGSGPILLCVPGTLGATYQSSMLSTARAFIHDASGPVSVASIPYDNGIVDIATRFLGVGHAPDKNVLALVLDRLRRLAPGRPVLLAGESQGSWLIADTLRADPVLAAAVTRVVLFAKPGFVELPAAIGSARTGASLLPATSLGEHGLVEWRHLDDIVPSLFHRLGKDVINGYLDAFSDWRRTGDYEYLPHHYDAHGEEAAKWLLFGIRPSLPTVHHSRVHRTTSGAA